MFGLITRKKHEAALALMAKANVDLEQDRNAAIGRVETISALYRSSEQRLIRERDEARAELAALRPDAEKYRRSRANLKQFRNKGVA